MGAGDSSLAVSACAHHETFESGSFDAGLRRASARPHSKFASRHRTPFGLRSRSEARTKLPLSQAGQHPHARKYQNTAAGDSSQAVSACARHETLESGSFDAGLRRASARPHSKFASRRSKLFGLRSRSEARTKLPLSQARQRACATRLSNARAGDSSQAGQLAHTTRRSKAVASMQACAVHLRDRTPNKPRMLTLLFKSCLTNARAGSLSA